MNLAIVVNKDDHKLQETSYSWCYLGMYRALKRKFPDAQYVHDDCSAKDIQADAILFFDLHSSHHIEIDGIADHPAVKIEYFNDPHQDDFSGQYRDGQAVRKLGAAARCQRALDRGVQYIICPYHEGFHRFLAPHLGKAAGDMLWWFPIAPDYRLFMDGDRPLSQRLPCILGSGWYSNKKAPPCYDFRKWAFERSWVSNVGHVLNNDKLAKGPDYGPYLAKHAGVLACMDYYPVPKYFEMPLSGCVTFVQPHAEYTGLGFEDGTHCIHITQDNFKTKAREFLWEPESFQFMADNARLLVMRKYTADHFANYVAGKLAETIGK